MSEKQLNVSIPGDTYILVLDEETVTWMESSYFGYVFERGYIIGPYKT